MLKPLKEYLTILNSVRVEKSKELNANGLDSVVNSNTLNGTYTHSEEFKVVGKKVKIKWSKDEIGDSDWKCGWYNAMVQSFSEENDTIDVMYFIEEDCVYTICVSDFIARGKLVVA